MTNTRKALGTKLVLLLILVFAVTLVVACGGDDAGAGSAVTTDDAAQNDNANAHEDDGDAHEDEGDHDGEGQELEGGALAVEADLVIDLELNDFAFLPAQLTITAGEVVHFNAENTSSNIHDFTIDKVDADMHIVVLPGTGEHAHMDGPKADVHFAFTETGRGAIQVRINEPGEYVYYCSVSGHREAGMEGTLIVLAAE